MDKTRNQHVSTEDREFKLLLRRDAVTGALSVAASSTGAWASSISLSVSDEGMPCCTAVISPAPDMLETAAVELVPEEERECIEAEAIEEVEEPAVEQDEEELAADVLSVLQNALARFVAMRETEGERLRADVLSRLSVMEEHLSFVEERSPQTLAEYRARLTARLTELLNGAVPDENRILTEVGIIADRLAVDEETVRLRSHFAQLRKIMESTEPVGRKLDFLVQEMNRETNTIGSKCSDTAIAGHVVEMKSEIEKIREQIQNIE